MAVSRFSAHHAAWITPESLEDKTEAEMAATARRLVVAARGGTAALRRVEPAAAAKHAIPARSRASRVGLGGGRVSAVPVAAPLPNVAAHIKKAQLIGFFTANRVCFGTGIIHIPSYLFRAVAAGINIAASTGPGGVRPAPRGVFPFRLGRQAVVFTSPGIQFFEVFLHVVPTDLFHRALVAIFKSGRVTTHYSYPFGLGYLLFAHVKTAQRHGVLGSIVGSARLGSGATHQERTAADQHHGRLYGAIWGFNGLVLRYECRLKRAGYPVWLEKQ